MAEQGHPTTGPATAAALADAVRDLDYAVRALQLYPPSSPVVGRALDQARAGLLPLLRVAPLALEVLPDGLRAGSEDEQPAGHSTRSLAAKLHQRGVARLHVDGTLRPSDLQNLAEMLAEDVDTLAAAGGIKSQCEQRRVEGIAVDMLQLDKLFEGDGADADPTEAVWERLLEGYGESTDHGGVDRELLAADSERFAGFLDWLLDGSSPPPQATEMSRLQLVRAVCGGIAETAAAIGPDRVDATAAVVGRLYDDLDNEIWIDLLGQLPGPGEQTATGVKGPGGEERAGGVGTELADLARAIGASLSREQVQDLLAYALTSREQASPRIYGLFHGLLEGRDERDQMEQAIREAVERQTTKESDRTSFEELWPRLTETFQGESIDGFVSTTYRAELEQLLAHAPLTRLWDLDRIAPRLRELESSYLVEQKVKVVLAILEAENDDDEYASLVGELERSLPELIVDGQYTAAEEVFAALAADLIPSSGRSDAQRGGAREVLVRLCNQHTLREVVRNLAGKSTTQIDAAGRIFNTLGPMAVPALLEALSLEQSRPLRVHLVRMLAAMGDQALPEIRKNLRDKRWFFVRNLLWIIGEIGDSRFAPHLGIIVNHPDVRVRREAVRSMAKLHGEATTGALLSAVSDSNPEVRLLAIRGLGTSGNRAAIPTLRELILLPNVSGKNTEMIRAAAVALGRLGASEAHDDLVKLARRPWLFHRRRAAATDAAAWAVVTLRGEVAGEAPELPRDHGRPAKPSMSTDTASPDRSPDDVH